MEAPLFTIITPSYNCADKLTQTIESVLSQDPSLVEYWIIDGGSTDSTTFCLQSYGTRLRWVSEPDCGIYDAMNKGIERASGRFLLFLGAGDRLFPDVLAELARRLPPQDSSVIYGDVSWAGRIYDGPFTPRKLCVSNICHQAMLFGRGVFQRLGTYSLKYPTAADWEFNIRCFGDQAIAKVYTPLTISEFEPGGISSHGDQLFDQDRSNLIRRHLGLSIYVGWRWRHYKRRLREKLEPALKTAEQYLTAIGSTR